MALKPIEQRPPSLVVIVSPPCRSDSGTGRALTCWIRTARIPAANVRAASSSMAETTTELVAGSTYQPVTESGTRSDRASNVAITECSIGRSGNAGAAEAGSAMATLSTTPRVAARSARRRLPGGTSRGLSFLQPIPISPRRPLHATEQLLCGEDINRTDSVTHTVGVDLTTSSAQTALRADVLYAALDGRRATPGPTPRRSARRRPRPAASSTPAGRHPERRPRPPPIAG